MILFLNNAAKMHHTHEEKLQNAPPAISAPRYRQVNRLADMSVGRIRRWNIPFRRPFTL